MSAIHIGVFCFDAGHHQEDAPSRGQAPDSGASTVATDECSNRVSALRQSITRDPGRRRAAWQSA